MTIISQVQLLVTPAWAARRMKGSERSVYMEIALYADKEGVTKKRSAFPAIKTIAEGVEMEERQVRRLLKSMNEKGIIRIEKRPGSSSIIHLPLDEPTPDMDVRTTLDTDVRTTSPTPDMDVRTRQGGPDMDVRRNIYIDPIKENNDHDHDPDQSHRKTRSVKTKATVIATPEELLFASQEINAWIKSAKDRGARNSQIQSSLVMMRAVHLEHCNEQYIKSYFSLAAEKRYYELQRAWVEEFIAKQESRKHQVNDFIPNASMAVPKVSPRDALVAKYGGKDVYMRLEEDGPIYITALHKADGVTGGLNDDYMVELWVDGKPRYIDYAEVESLMTTKEEYEGWNAFLNLF